MNIRLFTKKLLPISRPRFWVYEIGIFLLGASIATMSFDSLLNLSTFIFALYFLFPANVLIYGINDIFDYETDKNNPEKQGREMLVQPKHHNILYKHIILWNVPFFIYALFINTTALLWLCIFAFFAIFYSAKPIRAKIIPLLDSFFYAAYFVATGVFGYILLGGVITNWFPIVASILWAMAIHAYVSIQNIDTNIQVGAETVATKFGAQKTLMLCVLLYVIAGTIGSFFIGAWSIMLTLLYLYMIFMTRRNMKFPFRYYKIFPKLNVVTGILLIILFLFGV